VRLALVDGHDVSRQQQRIEILRHVDGMQISSGRPAAMAARCHARVATVTVLRQRAGTIAAQARSTGHTRAARDDQHPAEIALVGFASPRRQRGW